MSFTTIDFPKLRTVCGDTVPEKVISSGSEMLAVFISDFMTEDIGFLAEVKFKSDYTGQDTVFQGETAYEGLYFVFVEEKIPYKVWLYVFDKGKNAYCI